jgi:FPC/CPF motif-containing protein YcgG
MKPPVLTFHGPVNEASSFDFSQPRAKFRRVSNQFSKASLKAPFPNSSQFVSVASSRREIPVSGRTCLNTTTEGLLDLLYRYDFLFEDTIKRGVYVVLLSYPEHQHYLFFTYDKVVLRFTMYHVPSFSGR